MKNIESKESNSEIRSLKMAWLYSISFCVTVYLGWTFGLKYFAS